MFIKKLLKVVSIFYKLRHKVNSQILQTVLLTTKGKKAESLYKSPDFFQMTIKSFFKTI